MLQFLVNAFKMACHVSLIARAVASNLSSVSCDTDDESDVLMSIVVNLLM